MHVDTEGARAAVQRFMQGWQKCQWKKMHKATQQTWQEKYSVYRLKHWWDKKKLLRWDVATHRVISRVMVDVQVLLQYQVKGRPRTRIITVRVIKESGPFTPSMAGTWGVNPISCLREEVQPK